MTKLRAVLMTLLLVVHPRVYFKKAPSDVVFPYLVFDFLPSFENGNGQTIVPVDIDGWDNVENTTALETLMDSVKTAINCKKVLNSGIGVSFHLDSRLHLTDDDERINRRKHTYQARMFEI